MADTNRINSHFYQIAVSDADDNVWGIAANIGNVKIPGGNVGEVITTDGTGNLYWGVGGGGGNIQPLIEFVAPINGAGQIFNDANLATFTDGTYASVYNNGVLLQASEYTIVGTTLTVNSWTNNGDTITVGATGAGGGGGGGTGTVTNIATTQVDVDGLGFTLTGGPITTTGTATLNVPNKSTLLTALGIPNISNVANYPALNGNTNTYLNGNGQWVAVTGGGGTVTSVEGVGAGLGFSLTGAVTTSGNLTLATPTAANLRTTLNIGNVANINLNGNVSQVLSGNGTWIAQSGGAPGGSNTHVQFNNGGAFGGSANLTFNPTTGVTNIANLQLNDYVESVAATVNTGTVITPDFNAATIFRYTANSNFTFNGFLNPVAGKNAIVVITQDAVGGRLMSSTMKFAGGLKVLSTAPNSIDTIAVFFDGANYYASLVKGYA